MLLGPSLRPQEDRVGLEGYLKPSTEFATQERKAKEAKKKKRDSNVRRGEDAVKTRLESEKKAKKSGETSKTYKN